MLTEMTVKKAKATGKIYRLKDDLGLYLTVSATGTKAWQYRYKFNGKQQTYTIGKYPQVSLLNARIAHAELRSMVQEGVDPSTEKKLQKAVAGYDQSPTFKTLAEEWFEQKQSAVAERTALTVKGLLKNHIYPVIGDLPVKDIKPIHVLGILKNLEDAGKQNTAILARQKISEIFKFGVVTLRVETDPASPLQGYVKRKPTVHARAIGENEMQQLLSKLNTYQGRWVTRELVLFQMMTFLRSNEAIHVEWSDVDFQNSLIRIPSEKMKMSRPHLVPITSQLERLLKSTKVLTEKWQYVFPGVDKRRPMGGTTINNALRNAMFGYEEVKYGEITSHDFRATASTWLHEAGFLHDAIELQLAHTNKSKVVATYNQAEHLDRRREFMQWYHDKLESLYPELFKPRY